jgi:hypothetical protein
MGESTTQVSHCDAIVHAEGLMPDLFTSPALLNIYHAKVSGGMAVI